MKKTTMIKSTILTALGLCLIAGSANAKKPHKHKKNKGERGAIKEERMIDKQDDHGAHVEEGKDRRSSSISTYHKQTFSRIKALLKSGKITENQGSEHKTAHTTITNSLTAAKKDGAMTKNEITAIRSELDKLNDSLTAIAGDGEQDEERTPLLNKRQHQIEEAIESGIKRGRLSTLEANGIKRKLARLTRLEESLKKDKKISQREREKLFEEINEIHRDIKKDLRD